MKYDKSWELPEFEVFEFGPKKTKYCICIPVINEGGLFKKQLQSMKKYSQLADVLIADGGSTDGSTNPDFLSKNSARTLLIKRGPGRLGAQLRMGYAYALQEGYEGIITIDGNGKDGIEAIPSFIRGLDEGYDYTQGSRFIRGGKHINTPVLRYLAIRFIHAPIVSLIARRWLTDTTNGFRAYSSFYLLDRRVKPFRNIFKNYELLAYLSARAPRLGFKAKEVPVTRVYPEAGKIPTKISGLKGNIGLLKTLFNLALGRFNP